MAKFMEERVKKAQNLGEIPEIKVGVINTKTLFFRSIFAFLSLMFFAISRYMPNRGF